MILIAAFVVLVPLAPGQQQLPNFDRRSPVVLAVQNVGPAVVNIRTLGKVAVPRNPFFQRMDSYDYGLAERSLGSGVIVHEDGYVITNEHVVRMAERIQVALKDGRVCDATLVNTNVDSDLAVLKLNASPPFAVATLGNSDDLLVGETTIALGNPFGLDSSVTSGILSGTGRSVPFRGRLVFRDFLQTSAIIHPGNSGGPLLDINGRVIGINVAIDNRGPGIGYAIPVNRVKTVMTELLDPEVTRYAWLGFEAGSDAGNLIAHRVSPGGPAEAAGLKNGDHILAVGERSVKSPFELNVALQSRDLDEPVPVRYRRAGQEAVAQVAFKPLTLQNLAKGDRASIHGLSVTNLTQAVAGKLHLPENVRGPIVLEVEQGSGAEQIGLKQGDVIVQVESVAVPDIQQLERVLGYYKPRGSARIKVYREDQGLLEGRLSLNN
jgi:serine protease Do